MGNTQSLVLILNGVAVAAFVAALAAFARVPFAPETRRAVILAACVGALVYTVLYWALGDASFVFWDEEGELSPPVYRLLLSLPAGARFAPSLGGGNDAYAMFSSGAQYVLPERLYLWLFPTWIAIVLHKAAVFAVAFAGAYLLCRAATGCARRIAAAVGLLHPFSAWLMVNVTFTHGTSYAILPLAVYVLVWRIGRPHYWLAALIMAAVLGVESRPSHTLGALFLALAAGAVLLGKTRPRELARLAGAAALVLCFVALNWHEVLYAMWQVGPSTRRVILALANTSDSAHGLLDIIDILWGMTPVLMAAFVVSMAILALYRAPFAVRGGRALLVFVALWAIATAFPWEIVGLSIVKGIGAEYHLAAFIPLALPVIAAAAAALDAQLTSGPRWLARVGGAGVIAATAVAVMVWHTLNNASQLLYYGGQRQYTAIENLRDRAWRLSEPFRVVTLRRRSPEPNVVGAYYGLDTFDASLNLVPHQINEWWEYAINLPDGPTDSPYDMRLTTNWQHWDGTAYHLDAHVRIPALAVANVAFVVSPFALTGAGLTPVDEPAPDDRLWTFPEPLKLSYYLGRVRRLFRPGKVFIYAVADPLPRVYAASGIETVPQAEPVPEFAMRALKDAPKRIAVLRADDAARLDARAAPLVLRGVAPRTDGMDIALDAPGGGIVIVNQAFTPFWRAAVDGRDVAVTPADLIHMAIAVPPGGRALTLRYCRPLLREDIARRFGAARPCP